MVYQVPGILFSERLKSGYLVFVCLCAFFFFRQEVEGEEEGGQGRHAGGAAGNGNAQGAPYADDMLSVGSERSVVSEVRWYCIIPGMQYFSHMATQISQILMLLFSGVTSFRSADSFWGHAAEISSSQCKSEVTGQARITLVWDF